MGELSHVAGGGVAVNLARIALTILNIAQGRYQEALVHGLSIMGDDPCPHGSQVLPEVVEAAVRTGDKRIGKGGLRSTSGPRHRERHPVGSGTSGTAARPSSPRRIPTLTTDKHSICSARRTSRPISLAPILLFGEWLRREKRLTEARSHLGTAYELFETMGAAAFAERTRAELAATGGRTQKRRAGVSEELTPQERHIATLAAGGATNPEIAEQLFLSSATVDYHLRKVYRKLSVRSRRQLVEKL